jgi:hypothetical protein
VRENGSEPYTHPLLVKDSLIMINKEILETVLAFTQILILLILIIYMIKTWRIASVIKATAEVFTLSLQSMKEARDQEIAPYVIAYFDIPTEEQILSFVVKNIGKSTARDVKIQLRPALPGEFGSDICELPIFKNGISSLSPNQEIRTFVDSATAYFFEENDRPLVFETIISFYGGLHDTQRISEQVLDLTANKQLSKLVQRTKLDWVHEIGKISRSVEQINKELSILNDNLSGGIHLRNTVASASMQTEEDSWQSIVTTRLLEFNHLWSSLYGGKREKLMQPFIGKIKNRLSHITNQLLATASLSPAEANIELKNQVLDIIAKMADLNSIRISLDDAKTISSFNATGDKIKKVIEELVAKTELTA